MLYLFYLFTTKVCVTSHKSELCSHYKTWIMGITLTQFPCVQFTSVSELKCSVSQSKHFQGCRCLARTCILNASLFGHLWPQFPQRTTHLSMALPLIFSFTGVEETAELSALTSWWIGDSSLEVFKRGEAERLTKLVSWCLATSGVARSESTLLCVFPTCIFFCTFY